MTRRYRRLPAELRARVAQADQLRCAYCRMAEAVSGISLTIDHIVP